MDIDLIRQIMMSGFDGMNTLYDKHGFSEAALQVQSEGLVCLVAALVGTNASSFVDCTGWFKTGQDGYIAGACRLATIPAWLKPLVR